MLSDPFTTEDGDVILHAGTDDTFRVHKVVLSLASPVFKDLFRTAQPDRPDGGQDGLPPTIPITDPPESVDLILRFIYPGVKPPTITNPITLSALLTIADKYGVQTVLPVVEGRLADEEVVGMDPFGVYTVARRWGLSETAKKAARWLTLPQVMASPYSANPQSFAGDDFFRLVWYMQKRGEEGKRVIREHFVWDTGPFDEHPCNPESHSGGETVDFFKQLAERIVDAFEFDPCLDVERIVGIFIHGPEPPSEGFCSEIDLEEFQNNYPPIFCPIRPSRMMQTLCDLVSRLDSTCLEYLGKAMDGEFPVHV